MSLKTDFKDAILASGTSRKYQQINNPDGTVSLQDVSQYSQVGDRAQASVFNATNAEVNNHEANAVSHITPLSCSKTGTVYALTGLTASSGTIPCVFQAPATYVAGDTFTVVIPPATTPTTLTVVTSGGEALRAGAFLSGDIVGIHIDPAAQKLYIRQDSAPQVGAVQGNTKAWVATAATWDSANLLYILTIPGFVYSDGSPVTFKAPAAPPGSSVNLHEWCSIVINSTYYFLRTTLGNALSGTEWVANAEVTVILSPVSFPLSTGNNRGTAFVGLSNYADKASGTQPLTTAALRNAMVSQARASSFLGVGVVNLVVE